MIRVRRAPIPAGQLPKLEQGDAIVSSRGSIYRGPRLVEAEPLPGWIPPHPDWGVLHPELTAATFTATNAFRMAHGGDQPYGTSATLQLSSDWKVLHLDHYQYLDHFDQAHDAGDTPPCPRDWFIRIQQTGYDGGHPGFQGAAAENILYGSFDLTQPPAVVAAQLVGIFTSAGPGEGHYQNIVEVWGAPPVAGISVGVALNGLLWCCMDFGTGSSSPPPPVPSAPVLDHWIATVYPTLQKASQWKAWAKANPGELTIVQALLNSPSGQGVPASGSKFGYAIAQTIKVMAGTA